MLGTFDVTDAPASRRQKSRTEFLGPVNKGIPIGRRSTRWWGLLTSLTRRPRDVKSPEQNFSNPSANDEILIEEAKHSMLGPQTKMRTMHHTHYNCDVGHHSAHLFHFGHVFVPFAHFANDRTGSIARSEPHTANLHEGFAPFACDLLCRCGPAKSIPINTHQSSNRACDREAVLEDLLADL